MGKYKNATGAAGGVLLFFGILLLALTRHVSFFFLLHVITGTALVIAYIATHTGEVAGFFGKSSSRRGANTVAAGVLFTALIILVNMIAAGNVKRWDVTEARIHTLSEQSADILSALESDVTIRCFVNDESEERKLLEQLLERYTAISDHVLVSYFDPDREPLEAEKEGATHGIVIVGSGGKNTRTSDLSEEGITNAIKIVKKEVAGTVYYLQGHGERGGGTEEAGDMGLIFEAMRNEGFEIEPLDQAAAGVPEDASLLLVAGPGRPVSEAEASAVSEYLAGGGRCAMFFDPAVPDDRFGGETLSGTTGFEELLSGWGISLDHNIILEERLSLFAGSVIGTEVIVSEYGFHETVEKLDGKNTIFYTSRSLSLDESGDSLSVTPLAYSSEGTSWGETDADLLYGEQKAEYDEGSDKAGSLVLAAAAERGEGRLFVAGDSDIVSNQHIMNYFNADLFLDAVYWLTGEEDFISIRPRNIRSSHLLLTATEMNLMFAVAVIGIPELVLLAGLVAAITRRSR